ncbi:MAG TPA: hypothetical protein VHR72_04425 [Gemmataceae bacterium]|nr:hypothetical protein [Gemmataceae bacterium]
MTPQEVEEKIIELKHREPFAPFIVEMDNGQSIEVHYPNLAIAGTGAGFIDHEGALVDIDFKKVRAIRLVDAAEMA